ncbi:MAG: 3-isopropylmalate dehydratase small subunit, partial [Proteobacteria bacterium]|nr:3-isopropylmalate dehydratase small subunit [Pseudomonadota bacterium]
MKKFELLNGLVVPLDRNNVDTDAIIPKQFLKSIKRSGFGPNLFDEWRYLNHGEPGMDNTARPLNPDFVLNFPRYQGAQVLLARQNFGCGSSREHAPWALDDYGIRCVIASSYADIFYNNCFKNGILAIVLSEDIINKLFEETLENEGYSLKIDLVEQSITRPGGGSISFQVDAFKRKCLLDGLDDIGQSLRLKNEIEEYEINRRETKPWL